MLKLGQLSLKIRMMAAGLLTLGFVSFIMYEFSLRQYDVIFEDTLREKATYINRFYAMVIADALYRNDDIHLLLWIEQLMVDREVGSVTIVDMEGKVRYAEDLRRVGTPIEEKRVLTALETGQASLERGNIPNSLILVSPLNVVGQQRPTGAVRFDLIKNNTKRAKAEARTRFIPLALGLTLFAMSLLWMAIQRWVIYPIGVIRHGITQMAGQVMELHVPIWPDEYGDLVQEIKNTLDKFKEDITYQEKQVKALATQELRVIEQMARLFIGDQRILLIDVENRVLSDIHEAKNITQTAITPGTHLLDLVTDHDFSTLLTQALQNEGEVVKGKVVFQDRKSPVTLLSIPADEATRVKTLIVFGTEQTLLG